MHPITGSALANEGERALGLLSESLAECTELSPVRIANKLESLHRAPSEQLGRSFLHPARQLHNRGRPEYALPLPGQNSDATAYSGWGLAWIPRP